MVLGVGQSISVVNQFFDLIKLVLLDMSHHHRDVHPVHGCKEPIDLDEIEQVTAVVLYLYTLERDDRNEVVHELVVQVVLYDERHVSDRGMVPCVSVLRVLCEALEQHVEKETDLKEPGKSSDLLTELGVESKSSCVGIDIATQELQNENVEAPKNVELVVERYDDQVSTAIGSNVVLHGLELDGDILAARPLRFDLLFCGLFFLHLLDLLTQLGGILAKGQRPGEPFTVLLGHLIPEFWTNAHLLILFLFSRVFNTTFSAVLLYAVTMARSRL